MAETPVVGRGLAAGSLSSQVLPAFYGAALAIASGHVVSSSAQFLLIDLNPRYISRTGRLISVPISSRDLSTFSASVSPSTYFVATVRIQDDARIARLS